MRSWFEAYRGRDRGEVNLDALPEPYLGALDHRPVGVFLDLHPGKAEPDFQARSGLFADEIRHHGSYSAWAATWPYLRNPWVAAMRGPSPFPHLPRELPADVDHPANPDRDAMVAFELYPWHIATMTDSIRPDPGIVREFIWQPVRELGAPVFAFGKPWFDLLEDGLGLQVVDRWGLVAGPTRRRCPAEQCGAPRPGRPVVVAEKHLGGAGPPRRSETLVLREAIEPWHGEP
jgi:hypothetical protein